MSTNLVRMRNAAVAAKIETTPGVDSIAGPPAAADWVAGDCEVSFEANSTPDPSLSGSLDVQPAIAGGIRPSLRLRVPLRGSGTAATAPEWGKLMRGCCSAEVVQAAPLGAPTAASAGTVNSVTLPASPFVGGAQAYRGMPLLLTGTPVAVTGITDYSAARVAQLPETFGTALSASALCQIPAHVLYSPTSDEAVFRTLTIYLFRDGLRWAFTGAVGTWSIELTSGGVAFLVFEFRAQYAGVSAVALPAGWNSILRPTPPRWVAGRSQLDRALAQVRSLSVSAGIALTLPDNPEAAEGVDPAVPISRDVGGALDPLINVTTYVALFDKFRNGVEMPLFAVIGSTPGNRFALTLPSIRKTQADPTDRDGLGANSIRFQASGADAGVFLAAF
jgi:hypothetical protein